MKKYTEEELRKRFNIKDFRCLDKKRFIEIVSKLDSLNPEVAIALIGVIPDFYTLLTSITKELSTSVQKDIESTDKTKSDALTGIKQSIDQLQNRINDPSISENERIVTMSQIGKLWEQYERIMKSADEHKENVLNKLINTISVVALAGMAVLAINLKSN